MEETEHQTDQSPGRYVAIIGDIVSAYVSNNSLPHHELGALIATVHASITALEKGAVVDTEPSKREPAVSVKKSLNDEYLISMLDGKQYRTLKRHLSKHGMTPAEYRAEFGLPASYPMVAPSYSAQRSKLAKDLGLGNKSEGRKPAKLKAPGKPGRPRKDTAGVA